MDDPAWMARSQAPFGTVVAPFSQEKPEPAIFRAPGERTIHT
jgi:hypothetical protein